MRNLVSLLLIVLLFLNVLGYYGVFLGLQYKNDRSMTRKLDSENYRDSEVITIKVPIAVPYAADSRGFERVDGQFEYKGEFFRLVKQKLSQDTLFIVCIKDHENKKIHQALSNYVKAFSDEPADSSNAKVVTNFIKDYIAHAFDISNQSKGWVCDVVKSDNTSTLVPSFYCTIIHPPERA